jgi:hypothetical protein
MPDINNAPNVKLGKVVVEMLVSEGLILPEKQARILQALCDGKMTSSEWKSSIQTKVLKDEGKADDAKSDQED